MLVSVPQFAQLDDLLERICEKLQITQTQQETAKQRYEGVGEWLSSEESALAAADPRIYPQGSLRIGTTVKPLAEQEYDVDLVCELDLNWEQYEAVAVLNAIEARLRENKRYVPLIERKNRCLRLNYANEFHMDILPACPDCQKNHGCVKVPDRKAKEWKDSNPKGYAEWFENRAKEMLLFVEKAIEPFPGLEPLKRKPALKRTVQLIKRYRDLTFQDNPELAPISIILTTLAGMRYEGQASVNKALAFILSEIVGNIPNGGRRLVVLNPTNRDEDFSEKWDDNPALYGSFVQWVKEFNMRWMEVNATRGIHNIARILKVMFGETVTEIALKEQVEFMEKSRQGGTLRALSSTGTLVTAPTAQSIPVRKNTFHGE